MPARLWMLGEPISNYAPLRVIPPPPAAPRLLSVTDGINLLAGTQIETGTLKVNLEEVGPAPALTAALDGEELADLEAFCVDPLPERYTLNLKVPEGTAPGHHWLTVRLRGRAFAPVAIDIVA